jgi:hypothetical protein
MTRVGSGRGSVVFRRALARPLWVPVLLALGALACRAAGSAGQVNTERLRRDDLPPGLSGSLEGSVSLNRGNVDFTLVELGGRLDHSAGDAATFLVGRGDLGFQDGERFTRSGMVHLRRVQGTSGRVAMEFFGQMDHDRSRNLSLRWLVGAGPRVRIVDRDGSDVGWGVGYMFEHERLDLSPEDSHPDRTSSHRLTTYVTANVPVAEGGAASATVYAQPRVDAWGDVRVLAEARLAAELTDGLALTVTWNLRHDSRPPLDVARVDTVVKTGLAVALGGD